eukprot:750184_1
MYSKVLTKSRIGQNVRDAQYAVRGAIVIRAGELQQELQDPNKSSSLPFKRVTMCNIGNPQAVGQVPITFFRQVLACCMYPALLESKDIPADARERARAIMGPKGSIGAYTHSQGYMSVREHVAQFIKERDGHPANPNDIFLSDGASQSVKMALQMCISDPSDGVLIPIPQYPLHSSAISVLGGKAVGYYLNEEKGWSAGVSELARALTDAKKDGVSPKALFVVNPGNPTGRCMTRSNIQELIELAHRHQLVVLADEVYQTNIYNDDRPFYSFKKVLRDLGPDYQDIELISFHSTSKGMLGECGVRGGYMELTNIDTYAHEQLYKLASVNLCPNIVGQLMMGLMVNPPKKGDVSYELYNSELTAQYESLRERADLVSTALSTIDGITCERVDGTMYAFARFEIPEKAIEATQNSEFPPMPPRQAVHPNTGRNAQLSTKTHLRLVDLRPPDFR